MSDKSIIPNNCHTVGPKLSVFISFMASSLRERNQMISMTQYDYTIIKPIIPEILNHMLMQVFIFFKNI